MIHLRYDAHYDYGGHPQEVMKKLGITYQHATPQSICDQWWFWNCENVPEKLPEFLRELNVKPKDAIGYGLSEELAAMIEGGPDGKV